VRHGHWKSLTKTDYWPLNWSVTGGFCTFSGNRKSGMKWRSVLEPTETYFRSYVIQRKLQFFGRICRMKDARMLKAIVATKASPSPPGGQSTERKTMSRMDGWYHGLVQGGPAHTEMEGNRPGWVAEGWTCNRHQRVTSPMEWKKKKHKNLFTCFASRHIMKRYLGLESKSLEGCRWPWPPGLDTSFSLGFGICGWTASALWRSHWGHDKGRRLRGQEASFPQIFRWRGRRCFYFLCSENVITICHNKGDWETEKEKIRHQWPTHKPIGLFIYIQAHAIQYNTIKCYSAQSTKTWPTVHYNTGYYDTVYM